MAVWNWSVDTEDWKAGTSTASSWVERISPAPSPAAARPHPVVLMHNPPAGIPATVTALPRIIDYYRANGYRFVDLAGGTALRASTPAAARTATGLHLLVRNSAGNVQERTLSGSTWSGWSSLGGSVINGPAAAATARPGSRPSRSAATTRPIVRPSPTAAASAGGAASAGRRRRGPASRSAQAGWRTSCSAAGTGRATSASGRPPAGGLGTARRPAGAAGPGRRRNQWRRDHRGRRRRQPRDVRQDPVGRRGLVGLASGRGGDQLGRRAVDHRGRDPGRRCRPWRGRPERLRLRRRRGCGTSWTNWTTIGGLLSSGPAATVNGSALEIFVVGTDNRLYRKSATNGTLVTAWTGWQLLP